LIKTDVVAPRNKIAKTGSRNIGKKRVKGKLAPGKAINKRQQVTTVFRRWLGGRINEERSAVSGTLRRKKEISNKGPLNKFRKNRRRP